MINEIFRETQINMAKVVEHYRNEVATIRTGRANPGLVEPVRVDYYGSMSPLKNIAQISTPEPQVIVIQPFDPSSLQAIEKAIETFWKTKCFKSTRGFFAHGQVNVE